MQEKTKLLALNINAQAGILKVQRLEFVEHEGLFILKGAVGEGKTTTKEVTELAIAQKQSEINFDAKKFPDFDVEVEIALLGEKVFLHTKSDGLGKFKTVAYRKLADGKIDLDPVIKGKKFTAAALRDYLKTELTFGTEDFLSENERTHFEFIQKTFGHKLSELGVVFDKKSSDYVNSILWRLEQAIFERSEKYNEKRRLAAFKEELGDEMNIPTQMDIEVLKSQKNDLLSNKSKDLDLRIDKIKDKAAQEMSIIHAYNANLETESKNAQYEYDMKVRSFIECEQLSESLSSYGAPVEEVNKWIKTNKDLIEKPIEFVKVPIDELTNQLTKEAFEMSFNEKINTTLANIKNLRREIAPLIEEKAKPIDTSILDQKIIEAQETNKLVERWNAFFDWREADKKVKTIHKEYKSLFEKLDLGVKGLKIMPFGDENDLGIRTYYDGQHNPEMFGNLKGEPRLLTQYSGTQRPIIAILLQIALLEEKLKKDEHGLRAVWIECPIDRKTKELLIEIKKKYDIEIFASITGDYEVENLKAGEILVKGGELLTKK